MRRRLAVLLLAPLLLAACRTGGLRGAPTPTPESGPIVAPEGAGPADAGSTARLGTVPSLVGLVEATATANARRAGFETITLRVAGSPAGTVLSQDRPAGRAAPLGTPIGIRVADGRAVGSVSSAPVARLDGPALPAAPLPGAPSAPPSFTTPPPASPPAGPVVPAPPTFVTPTDPGVVVPPVLDRTPEQARRIVEDAGLAYREEPATGGIPGRVMDQDPPAGARRPRGAEIVVKIPPAETPRPATPPSPAAPPPAPSNEAPADADGRPASDAVPVSKIIVPSVLDKTEAVARRILEDLGFRVRGEAAASGVAGRVMDQRPLPGETVAAGSAVVIRIPGYVSDEPATAPVATSPDTPIPESDVGSPDSTPSAAPPAPPPAPVVEVPAPPPAPPPAPVVEVPAPPPALPPAPVVELPAPPLAPPPAPVVEVPAPPPAPPPAPVVEPPSVPRPAADELPAPPPPFGANDPIFASPFRPGTSAGGDSLPPPPPAPIVADQIPASPPPAPSVTDQLPPAPPAPPAPPVVAPIESPPVAPAPPPPPPVDPGSLPIPATKAPRDGAELRLGARVVVEATWEPVATATGYLLEVEEVVDGTWVAVERRVVKGVRAVLDLEPPPGPVADFRWRVRTVVGRKGGKPSAWSTFRAR